VYIIYSISIWLYSLGIRLASFWNPKARLWVDGRKDIFTKLENDLKGRKGQTIWMHCASLGEFEQGRPLLEAIRKAYPQHFMVLSFFSPSGYEIRKNYPGADLVCYLPADSQGNADTFIQLVQPSMALFVKYEFWYHYLNVLKNKQVPTFLVSAIFREEQPFFKNYGGFWRKMLDCYHHIFVQDEKSLTLLRNAGFGNRSSISGDTRFDRVRDIAGQPVELPEIAHFCAQNPVMVAGSTWIEDEEILDHYANQHPGTKFIIAPHEIDETHLREIEKMFKKSLRYSALSEAYQKNYLDEILKEKHVLIMDNMGMLSKLYRFAMITYVGGGFGGAGIHNILEAAAYGKPVIFGPVNQKSREAQDLQELGTAFTISSALELESLLDDLFNHPERCEKMGQTASAYVQKEAGATKTIMHYIQENRLLTN
jgi:3-deoxy-D-manno-octulosonic-acid transferase